MSALAIPFAISGTHSVVPNSDGPGFPPEPDLTIKVQHGDLVDVVIDKVTLILRYVHDPITETSVDKECFPAGDGISPYDGVFGSKDVALVQGITTLDVVSHFQAQFLRFGVEELGVVAAFKSFEV